MNDRAAHRRHDPLMLQRMSGGAIKVRANVPYLEAVSVEPDATAYGEGECTVAVTLPDGSTTTSKARIALTFNLRGDLVAVAYQLRPARRPAGAVR